MISIDIYRSGRAIPITVDIDDRCVYSKKLMGEHKITSEFIHNSASALDITIGDYITYPASGGAATGENYFINQLPSVVKINDSTFKYNVDFQANLYNLNKKLFKDGANGLTDLRYDGSPVDFISKILTNINEINPTWASGTCSTGIDKTLQFTNESCLSALSKIAEAYKMEYDITDKVISLQDSIAGASGYSFEYGRENGLYKLTREQVLNQNIITRCYGFGGQTNIPDTYRNGNKRLIFAPSGYAASGYLDSPSASALYGTIEGVFVDDNIFPERTGTITAVTMNFDAGGSGAVARIDKITKNNASGDCTVGCNGYSETMVWNTSVSVTVLAFYLDHQNDFGAVTLTRISNSEILFMAAVPGVDFAAATITPGSGTADNLIANAAGGTGTDLNPETSFIEDTSINFDINDYNISGQTASVVFKSGVLSGVQCEISHFDYTTKRIYIESFTDSDGYIQPNATHLPVIGDTYTLVNIIMPQTYIDTAEATLQAATQRYLNENCAPHVLYTLEIDPKDAKLNNISLKAGNRVTIIDSALSINKLIRISSIEYPLVNPYKIKVVLANPVVPHTLQDRLIKAASIITKGALFSTSSPIKGMVPGANNAGASYFLNAKGAWTVPAAATPTNSSIILSSTYPASGIALSTGTAWGTSLVNTTVGNNLITLANPGAITFIRLNANNSVSALNAANFKTALALVSSDVGLGNVTNESKATMFTNPTFTGQVSIGTTTKSQLLNLNSSTANSAITFSLSDVTKGYIGAAYGTNSLINGSVGGDIALRSEGGKIMISADVGNTSAITILTSHNVIIGGTAGSQKLTLFGELGIRAGNNIIHYDSTEANYWLQVPNGTTEYYWSYNGTWQKKLSSSGTLTVKGDVICYGV